MGPFRRYFDIYFDISKSIKMVNPLRICFALALGATLCIAVPVQDEGTQTPTPVHSSSNGFIAGEKPLGSDHDFHFLWSDYKYLIWNGPVTAFKIATYSYHGTHHNIASLQFKYGKKWAPVRGEDREDMEWQEFELERGEYITQINHKSSSIIHSLQLVSNKRTFPAVGNGTNCPAKAGVIRISSGFPRFGYVTGYSTVWKGFRYVSGVHFYFGQ